MEGLLSSPAGQFLQFRTQRFPGKIGLGASRSLAVSARRLGSAGVRALTPPRERREEGCSGSHVCLWTVDQISTLAHRSQDRRQDPPSLILMRLSGRGNGCVLSHSLYWAPTSVMRGTVCTWMGRRNTASRRLSARWPGLSEAPKTNRHGTGQRSYRIGLVMPHSVASVKALAIFSHAAHWEGRCPLFVNQLLPRAHSIQHSPFQPSCVPQR